MHLVRPLIRLSDDTFNMIIDYVERFNFIFLQNSLSINAFYIASSIESVSKLAVHVCGQRQMV